VKHALYLVLLAKGQTALQSVIDRLIETGKCYGKKMNVDKTEVRRISKEAITSTDYDRSKKTGECAIVGI
jgi:hypothetical protein